MDACVRENQFYRPIQSNHKALYQTLIFIFGGPRPEVYNLFAIVGRITFIYMKYGRQ